MCWLIDRWPGFSLLLLMGVFGCANIVAQPSQTPFTFDYPDTVYVCETEDYLLEIGDGQPDYQYQWFFNSNPINGQVSFSHTATRTGYYFARITVNGGPPVYTDTILVWKYPMDKPTSSDEEILVCEGRTRTLTVRGYPTVVTKRWYRNDVLMPGENDTTLRVTADGRYKVELLLGSCSIESDELVIRYVNLPAAQIMATATGLLCYGTTTTLTAEHPADGVYSYLWSTGQTTRSIDVDDAGEYSLTLTNSAGCSSVTSVSVLFRESFQVPRMPDTVICPAERQPIRLTAPAGFAAYEWGGAGGISMGSDIDVSRPGTYTLRVQDDNGCWATTSFVVRQACADVDIPNMFSPNGDGLNDVWSVSGLEYDPQAEVFVVDRNGREVFRSRGTETPWDGTFNGRLVPVGAYFYSIRTAAGMHYRGAVTLVY